MSLLKRSSSAARSALRYDGPGDCRPKLSDRTLDVDRVQGRQLDELGQLRAMLARYEQEAAVGHDSQKVACDTAFERGREKGKEEAESLEAQRLATLSTGVDAMLAALRSEVQGAGDTANEIARAALDRILGDAGNYGPLIAETVRHHAATLLEGTLVRVEISAADFPDNEALAHLPQLGKAVEVHADPTLETGSCRFKLTLGELDVSIPRQAAAVRKVLDQSRQGSR